MFSNLIKRFKKKMLVMHTKLKSLLIIEDEL
ncbi:MAG: hypothetical protein ACJAS3_003186 [Roseivirga sp.]|jgi:hypothetical protein